ncbi:AraC family transcriptional regulator [Romboutsia hominis]|uniref:AraC family transcriptional regulator n=1 Tax=Romboutsia hominis TaxID=1507512 RepID=UPI001F067F2F|nr:AraC family transcriptional regulator [Romboutsia hominis]MCH1960101.1 AraC family transcriptional regulator [Romboutsia hominis]MCH1969468.1 AraC family transcriptional regulator [Romboutsia hominis]
MKSKVNIFRYNQNMDSEDFEIFYYKNIVKNEIPIHVHDFYEVCVFLSGNIKYKVNDLEYKLRYGDVILIPPDEEHGPIFLDTKSTYERIVLWISKSYMEKISTMKSDLSLCFNKNSIYYCNYLHPNAPDCKYIISMLDQFIDEHYRDDYASDIYSTSILGLMLAKFNRMSMNQVDCISNGVGNGFLMSYIVDYINKHYNEKITLDYLEKYFFVSKYYISHEFKKLLGISIGQYITHKRLENAKKLMHQGLLPSKIYEECGYNDYATFYRAFKMVNNMTPSEYMKKISKNSKITNITNKI